MEDEGNYEMIAGKEAIISLEKNSSYEVPRAEKMSESENPLEVKYKYKIPACGHRRNNKQRSWQCACSNSNQAWPHDTISSFVGNDYFCDSGNHGSSWSRIINASNPISGMARGVVLLVPAASSTTLHGSVKTFPGPPLMTWRSESARVEILKTHLLNYLSFMYNRMYGLVYNKRCDEL